MEIRPSSVVSAILVPSVAADYPSWVMLEHRERMHDDSTRDASTSASCIGSMGNIVQVSFRLVAPPAVSTLHVEISGTYSQTQTYPAHDWFQDLISAHRDSVLIELSCCPAFALPDIFVYMAGGARGGARLLLLPPYDEEMYVGRNVTGILRRRGGDEFVVASMVIDGRTSVPVEASMWLLRSGERKWEHRSGIPVLHADGHEAELSWWTPWNNGSVITVGDQFLYWIDPVRGIIISDVTNKIPELRYVPLPADPFLVVTYDGNIHGPDGRHGPRASRNVCVTVAGAVRFIRISPRCCCGWFRTSSCARSQRDFTITTWTLRTDDMTWKEDCVLDSGDPWAVAVEAAGVPLVPPAFPFVSIEDPDVVCFLSSESIHQRRSLDDYAGDKSAWLVTVDTRRKTLRSVCRYPEEDDDSLLLRLGRPTFLPSEVSRYFNATCHCGNVNPVSSRREDEEETDVLAAIREIPDMAREEMTRAHSLVAGDDRRVRFLGALPVGMRKEYCVILTELERNLKPANDVITASS